MQRRDGAPNSPVIGLPGAEPFSAVGDSLVIHEWRGAGPPRMHVHHSDDEAWHVLEGSLRFTFTDGEMDAPAGTTVLVRAGVAHTFRVVEPASYLSILTPRLHQLIAEWQSAKDDDELRAHAGQARLGARVAHTRPESSPTRCRTSEFPTGSCRDADRPCAVRFAIGHYNCEKLANPRTVADFARTAEDAGWDGYFICDHLGIDREHKPACDPFVVAGDVRVGVDAGTTTTRRRGRTWTWSWPRSTGHARLSRPHPATIPLPVPKRCHITS